MAPATSGSLPSGIRAATSSMAGHRSSAPATSPASSRQRTDVDSIWYVSQCA
jgi:hypothetical protein